MNSDSFYETAPGTGWDLQQEANGTVHLFIHRDGPVVARLIFGRTEMGLFADTVKAAMTYWKDAEFKERWPRAKW